MSKVFILPPIEDWIVDRLISEWYNDNPDISTKNISEANVVWLLASWCYKNINKEILKTKKVITTIHHVVEEKFDRIKLHEFLDRDSITSVYHVPNEHTANFVKKLTNKPIHIIPYWANQKIWKKTGSKEFFRKKYQLPENSYLIGSFQRDTEGHDLKTPKLEKGPDLLANAIEILWTENKNLHVVLGGWRRQYIISRLESMKVPYSYFERPSQEIINELYQAIDLYPITSRCEGGPQALIECGLLNIPVISRDIGIARQVLSKDSICDDVTKAFPSVPNVDELKLPNGYQPYRKLIEIL